MKRFLLILAVLLIGCDKDKLSKETPGKTPTSQIGVKTFTGHGHFGWEWSLFQPFGEDEKYWVELDNDAGVALHQQLDALSPKANPGDDQHAIVTLKGKVSGPGKYGHLGGYRYLLGVTEVVDVRLSTENDPAERK